MRALIIDDDSSSRMLLKAVLERWGYEIFQATDGQQGWNLLSANDPPRLLIIDWMMPGITGPELCQKIANELDRERFYILMLSARGDRQDLINGLEAGADDFITKPWNNEELKARVNVGKRVLTIQEDAARRQKLEGVLEMAGAVCHELNQPLQVAVGYADMLLWEIEENDPKREPLERIVESVNKMGELTKKIMNLTDCKTLSYLEGHSSIIDIHKSSEVPDDSDD